METEPEIAETDTRLERQFDRWSRHILAGILPGPISPFTKSVITPLLEQATRKAFSSIGVKSNPNAFFFSDIYGRLYVNSALLRDCLSARTPIFGEILPDAYSQAPDEKVDRWNRWWGCVSLLARSGRYLKTLKEKVELISTYLNSPQTRILRNDLRGKSDASIYLQFEKVYNEYARAVFAVFQEAVLCSVIAHSALRNAIIYFTRHRNSIAWTELLTYDENKIATDLWKLARLAASIGDIPDKLLRAKSWGEVESDMARIEGGELFLKRLKKFLDNYGDKCFGFLELSRPRWHENPMEVSVMMNAIVKAGEATEPLIKNRTAAKKAREAFRKLRHQKGIMSGIFLNASIRQAKKAHVLHSVVIKYMEWTLGDLRSLAAEAGRRFKARGELASASDVFFLTMNEIKQVLALEKLSTEMGDLVEERREEFNNLSELKSAPSIISSDEQAPQETGPYPAERYLYGAGVSGESCTGAARVVTDPVEICEILPGEVVIVTEIDDTFAPVAAVCGAMVIETGGSLSGGAVAARCFGIPCVTMVEKACSLISNGDIITVDGVGGKITVKSALENC